MNIFEKFFGNKTKYDKLELRVYKQANAHGEHGRVNVTHVKHGLVEASVAIVFVGVTTPPKMDRNTMNYLWEELMHQGYIPHYVEAYGNNNEIVNPVSAPAAEVTGLPKAKVEHIKEPQLQ